MIFSVFLLTMAFPVIMFPVNIVLFVKDKKHSKIYAFLIAFAFAAVAFNFAPTPDQNTDLIRHYANMQRAHSMTFSSALSSEAFESLMGYYLLLKFFSFAEMPILLPTFVTLLGYYILLYMVSKMDTDRVQFNRFVAMYVLLGSVSFLGFCSGIRQYTLFVIVLVTFYMETKNNKLKPFAVAIYLLLVTVHTSMVLFIVLRLVLEIILRFKNMSLLLVLILFWGATRTYVINFIENFFGENVFVETILDKSEYYEEHASSVIIPNYFFRVLLLAFCLVVVIRLNKIAKNHVNIPKKYLYLCLILGVFSLGSVTNYDIFARFSIFTLMFVAPLLPAYLKSLRTQARGIMYLGILSFISVVLVYNITQYATFNFNGLEEILSTNIFSILGGI